MEPFLSETLRARLHLLYQSITFNTSKKRWLKGQQQQNEVPHFHFHDCEWRVVLARVLMPFVVARQDALFVCPFGSIAPTNGGPKPQL